MTDPRDEFMAALAQNVEKYGFPSSSPKQEHGKPAAQPSPAADGLEVLGVLRKKLEELSDYYQPAKTEWAAAKLSLVAELLDVILPSLAPSAPARAEEVGPRELMVFAWEKTAQRLLKHRSGPGTEFDAALRDLESLFARAITAPAPTESAPAGLDAVREALVDMHARIICAPQAGEPGKRYTRDITAAFDAVMGRHFLDRHRAAESAPDAEAARLLERVEATLRISTMRLDGLRDFADPARDLLNDLRPFLRHRAAGAPKEKP